MNQSERLEWLMAHYAGADHGAILRVIDEELRMLRAMAILAFGATRDPNMRVVRSVATALRGIVGGPPTVSPAPPEEVRKLIARAVAMPARDPKQREAKKKALAEATAAYARWERTTPAGRLAAGATDACMRLGLAWDARPFKLSRPEVRLRLIDLCEEALGRHHRTAAPEQRAEWVSRWIQEVRALGCPHCRIPLAEEAFSDWINRAAAMTSAENVATEVVLRLAAQEAFLDTPGRLHDIAAALATKLSVGELKDAERTARIVQQHLFGGDARNSTKFLDMRIARGGRRKRERSA